MKKGSVVLFLLAFLFISQHGYSQLRKTENLVIVTLDGMRWQEVFGGMDSALVVNKKYTRDSASIVKAFGGATREIRPAPALEPRKVEQQNGDAVARQGLRRVGGQRAARLQHELAVEVIAHDDQR